VCVAHTTSVRFLASAGASASAERATETGPAETGAAGGVVSTTAGAARMLESADGGSRNGDGGVDVGGGGGGRDDDDGERGDDGIKTSHDVADSAMFAAV